jgi:uncharacterized damage-inducible protein DinB
MARIDALLEEFTREARTARRHLERLPEEHFSWRPHAKSFTAGELAGHMAECVRWAEQVFAADELDVDPASYECVRPGSVASALEAFDAAVDGARLAMEGTADRDASQPWRMSMRGAVMFEKRREAAFRDMSLSHLIHHRGQLTVYLRLLDVPLAGTYGPTADDRG